MVNLSKIIGFDSRLMFKIVADTDKYSEFIPFCSFSDKRPLTPTCFKSTLSLQSPLSFSYESTVRLLRNKILAESKNQAIFSTLTTTWLFKHLHEGISEIDVTIEYTLTNGIYAPIASVLVPSLTHTYVSAFRKRAMALHGQPTTPQMLLRTAKLSPLERVRLEGYDRLYKSQSQV